MVLTKSELITTLQNEVRILLHLASKVDRDWEVAARDEQPLGVQRLAIVGQVRLEQDVRGDAREDRLDACEIAEHRMAEDVITVVAGAGEAARPPPTT